MPLYSYIWYGKACYGVVSNSMVEDIMGKIHYVTNWCPIESKQAHTFMDMYIPRAKSDVAITIVPHTIESKRFYRINYKKMPKESKVVVSTVYFC